MKESLSRRVKWGILYATVAGALFAGSVSQMPAQNATDLKPPPQQTEWQDMEFGVIIHFSTNTFLACEWGDGTVSPQVFNPTDLKPDQWIKAIRASGAKYVVLVAKHHDGFCLWPTAQTAGAPYRRAPTPQLLAPFHREHHVVRGRGAPYKRGDL